MSATRPTVLLEYYLKQLKMPTMLREHAAVAATCGKENADYATYLERLTHRVHIIEANGESYRLKHAKKKTLQEKRRD